VETVARQQQLSEHIHNPIGILCEWIPMNSGEGQRPASGGRRVPALAESRKGKHGERYEKRPWMLQMG
jgi:hypothetical protein